MSSERSQDNAKFASSGGDRSVFVWDVATGTTTRRLSGHMGKIHVVDFNEDASVVASGEYVVYNYRLDPNSHHFQNRLVRLNCTVMGSSVRFTGFLLSSENLKKSSFLVRRHAKQYRLWKKPATLFKLYMSDRPSL